MSGLPTGLVVAVVVWAVLLATAAAVAAVYVAAAVSRWRRRVRGAQTARMRCAVLDENMAILRAKEVLESAGD
jgi:hypothetical protein